MTDYLIATRQAGHIAKYIEEEDDLEVIYLENMDDSFEDGGFEGKLRAKVHEKRCDEDSDDGFNCLPNFQDGKYDNLFDNNEIYTKLSGVEDFEEDSYVAVLHSGQPYPTRGMNDLESILYWLKDEGKPEHVDVFFSHFPYQMAEEEFEPGQVRKAEMNFHKVLSFGDRQFNSYSEEWEQSDSYSMKIFAVNPHFSGNEWVDKYIEQELYQEIDAVPLIKKLIRDDFRSPTFVALDEGAERRFDVEFSLNKVKNGLKGIDFNFEQSDKPLNGVVAVLDDLTESGNSIIESVPYWKELGADKIVSSLVHAEDLIGIRQFYDSLNYGSLERVFKEIIKSIEHSLRNNEKIKDGRVIQFLLDGKEPNEERDYSLTKDFISEKLFETIPDIEHHLKNERRGLDRIISSMPVVVTNSVNLNDLGVDLGSLNSTIADIRPILKEKIFERRERLA